MAAKIQGPAPIIRAAIATLTAEMPAHVAAWNAEPENQIDLEVPVAYVFGADDARVGAPVVEVAILDGTLGPFELGSAGVGSADHTPALQVVVWLEGTTGDAPTLYEQALGYVRTIVEILTVDGALGPTAEVSGTRDDAVRYRIEGPLPVDPSSVAREFRKWRYPVVVELVVEAIDHWINVP